MGPDVSQLDEQKQKTLAGLKLPPPFITAGVDVGQQVDPTTLVIAEASTRFSGQWQHIPERFEKGGYYAAQDIPILETHFDVRFVKRLELGTKYPAIAHEIAFYLTHQQFAGRRRVLRVDITGVGRPVYELIEDAIKHGPEPKLIHCKPITFTHGNTYKRETGVLGKAYGVSRLQALIQTSCIRVAARLGNTSEARKLLEDVLAMLEELKVYEIKVDKDANDKYGAFETGTHDDLATALMLCCLEDHLVNTVTIGPKIR